MSDAADGQSRLARLILFTTVKTTNFLALYSNYM